nr:hypothetical protein [Candidatus Sigynarchaeota archaeon]
MPFKTLMVQDYDKETFEYTAKIAEDEIAFIISDSDKTVFVWNGQKASKFKLYKGGTLATKIKSLYHLYGFKTLTVNQGEEVGVLKTEITNLLQGRGTKASDEEKGPSKAAAAVSEHALTRAAQPAVVESRAPARAPPAPVAVEKPAHPAIVEPVPDKRVKELEEELEAEKKKATHRYTKLKEEIDALKENYEKRIIEVRAEAAKSSKDMVSKDKYD